MSDGGTALTFYLIMFARCIIKIGKEYRFANQSWIKKIMGTFLFAFIYYSCVFMVEQSVYFSGYYGMCVLSECIIREFNAGKLNALQTKDSWIDE